MNRARLDRRQLLRLGSLGAGTAVGLGALGYGYEQLRPHYAGPSAGGAATSEAIGADDPEVAATERRRRASGRTTKASLTAAAVSARLHGRGVSTWSYGSGLVGPTLQLSQGDRLTAAVTNDLAAQTTIHWHGIRIRNDMDGVAPTTQSPITADGGTFTYGFVAADPGTYWYHAHVGLQNDRALFGALIVEDPHDPTGADLDAVLVIDDWVDGLGTTPDDLLHALNPELAGADAMGGMDTGGTDMDHATSPSPRAGSDAGSAAAVAKRLVGSGMGRSTVLGGMTQHIDYPLHLVNGRSPENPTVVEARAGQVVRLRIINAAAETPYRLAVAGHQLTVVAADGYYTQPTTADTVLLGMAQRLDVLVRLKSGSWPIIAAVEGRPGHAGAAILRSHDARTSGPLPTSLPEHDRRLVLESRLRPAESTRLDRRVPDRAYQVDLIQAGDRYVWGMGGKDAGRLVMKQGERVRITMRNTTTMWHPMHTHGHTFAVPDYGGLRRDTVIVLPRKSLAIEFDADNPGAWVFHCHNAYHMEAGMTTNLTYIR